MLPSLKDDKNLFNVPSVAKKNIGCGRQKAATVIPRKNGRNNPGGIAIHLKHTSFFTINQYYGICLLIVGAIMQSACRQKDLTACANDW